MTVRTTGNMVIMETLLQPCFRLYVISIIFISLP